MKSWSRWGPNAISLACLVGVLVSSTARAVIDDNVTKEIWKSKYGVTAAQLADSNWLAQDSDGDGMSNGDEIAAGTSPFKGGSVVRVTGITADATNVSVSFPSILGKQYVLQGSPTLTGFQVFAPSVSVMGDGTEKTLVGPKGIFKFFRVLVQDIDTDNDGLSDWAELEIMFDPNTAQTVPGVNDYDFVSEQVTLPNDVSIVADVPFASEDGPTSGCLRVTRGQSLFPVTITYNVGGTAVPGVDYQGLAGTVNMAVGEQTVDVLVNPMNQPAALKGGRSVTATLNAAGPIDHPYTLGAPSEATVIINDSTVPGGTGLLAQYWDYAGYSYVGDGNFGQTASYTYTKTFYGTPNAGKIVVTPSGSPVIHVGDVIPMTFSSGNLNDPLYNGQNYTVTAVSGGYFTLAITGASLPSNSSGNCSFTISSSPPAPVITRVDATVDNDWGTGMPAGISTGDNFAVRWTGQVQPQFSEVYTFVVHADDGCKLTLNGQVQALKTLPATNSGGSTYLYNSATGDTVVTYTSSLLQPGSFAVGEYVRLDPASGNLTHAGGSTYSYDGVTGDAVINYSNLTTVTPGGFAVGQTVEVDPTSGTLSTLGALPYEITAATSSTFTINFGTGIFGSGSGSINISDNLNLAITAVTANTYTVNFGAGKYANGSTGTMNMDIINRPLKDFASMGNERYVRIPMTRGVRYDIQLDYYESTSTARCRLFWFSPSQPKQIIPSDRLYPADGPLAPPAHVSETDAIALVGGSFSVPVAGSNGANVSLSGNPAWLTYSNGMLSGTPPSGAAGDYQVVITITNALGTSTSILNLHVDEIEGTVVREYWNGVAGTTVASIPTDNAPSGTENLTSLEAATNFGDDYGARIRGYITAPVTGNYYFWIAANNAAELWISNDDETVNAFQRASVTTGSATPRTWNGETNQKSPWLALVQGRRYYFEILHKAGVGAGDNLAVGWSKPGEGGAAPSEVVPGYMLSPYVAPAPGSTPGTLYIATMLAQGTAVSNGVGVATFRLSDDENVAIVNFDIPAFLSPPYGGLTGIMTDWHVHSDAYQAHPSSIMYDPTAPPPDSGPQPDGSHKWTIPATSGTLTKADIIELIKQGKAYINLHTAAYPAGEIRGNFTLANGTRTFSPPPDPPAWSDDHTTNVGAIRFLQQATFGANIADIQALQAMPSYEAWIDDQFIKPASHQLPEVYRTEGSSAQGGNFSETLTFNAWWMNSIAGDDQLRQRIAFALSQIHVVSGQGPLQNNAPALSYFYDKLADNAFGNFADILKDTTLTPSMGRYLDMLRNDKPDQALGRIPNENYAREIKQLFSVGLFRMWPDGTLMLTSNDSPIDTYSQREIVGFSHVFTGWDYGYDGAYRTALNAPANWARQMREVPARHFTGSKRILNNEVLPGLLTLGGQPLDPYATHNSAQYYQSEYQDLPGQELEASHQQLFNHPNVGPFICRQLIQRLVTSHPTRDYLYRVVQKFNDNGSGVRGDMKAVIKAILLDYEARSSSEAAKPAFGKQREPLLRVAAAGRAFRPPTFSGTYSQTGTRTITIDTATPHNLSGNVFLDFTSGSPAPWSGAYGSSIVNTTRFTVQAQNWATGTYNIPAGSTTCTVTMGSHWLQVGNQMFVDFTSGAADGTSIDAKTYTVLTNPSPSSSGNNGNSLTFDVVGTSGSVRSGNVMFPRFSPGSYTSVSSGLPAPNDRRVTMDTPYDHHLNVGNQVQLNFYGGNPIPVDMVATVESVVDVNTWTFLAPSAGTNLGTNQGNNSVFQFPLLSQPLNRSGNVGSRPSTFSMNNTNAVIDQSPINSPTVFNYFLPDFKNPGALASQGITTPEFQTTAETTVVSQANYFYNGIFNPNVTNGYSSFTSGSNSLVMDLSRWMLQDATNVGLGVPTNLTVPWTHNENISLLIDQLSTLLAANQLSPSAKNIIKNFVSQKISSINTGNPCIVNTNGPHGYSTGATVCISGLSATDSQNGTFSPSNAFVSSTTLYTITVIDSDTFTVTGVSCSSSPTSTGLANAHVSPVVYNQGTTTPSTTNIRDRLRAVVHLILTSPDFIIQR